MDDKDLQYEGITVEDIKDAQSVWGLDDPEIIEPLLSSIDDMSAELEKVNQTKVKNDPRDAIMKLSKMGFKMIPEKRRCTKKKRKRKK